MSEYAEIQWQREMRRGFKDKPRLNTGRNQIAAHCPICGKGIRTFAGDTSQPMKAHMKAKHKGETK